MSGAHNSPARNRCHEFKVWMTDEEAGAFLAEADKLGVTRPDLFRLWIARLQPGEPKP